MYILRYIFLLLGIIFLSARPVLTASHSERILLQANQSQMAWLTGACRQFYLDMAEETLGLNSCYNYQEKDAYKKRRAAAGDELPVPSAKRFAVKLPGSSVEQTVAVSEVTPEFLWNHFIQYDTRAKSKKPQLTEGLSYFEMGRLALGSGFITVTTLGTLTGSLNPVYVALSIGPWMLQFLLEAYLGASNDRDQLKRGERLQKSLNKNLEMWRLKRSVYGVFTALMIADIHSQTREDEMRLNRLGIKLQKVSSKAKETGKALEGILGEFAAIRKTIANALKKAPVAGASSSTPKPSICNIEADKKRAYASTMGRARVEWLPASCKERLTDADQKKWCDICKNAGKVAGKTCGLCHGKRFALVTKNGERRVELLVDGLGLDI